MRDCARAVSFRSICSSHYSRLSDHLSRGFLGPNFLGLGGGLFQEQHLVLQQGRTHERLARYLRYRALHSVARRKQLGYFPELPSNSSKIPHYRGMFVPAERVRHGPSFGAIGRNVLITTIAITNAALFSTIRPGKSHVCPRIPG